MLPCIELTRVDGTVYSQPVNDIRHIFEMPSYVVVIRITNRKAELVTESFNDVVTAANLDLVPFQDAGQDSRNTAVNRAYVHRVVKLANGQAIIVLKTEQSFYPVEDFDTLSPLFAQVSGGGGGGGATQLSDLTDVNTSAPTNGNVLIADGTDWESRALTVADISDYSASSGILTRATLLTDGLSVVVTFIGGDTTPILTKVGAGDYRLTVPADEKITAIKIKGTNAHQTGSGSFKFRITDVDGHYYQLAAPLIWASATNQQSDSYAAGVIPAWTNSGAGERAFEWVNIQFYGASGFEIVSVCI